MTIVAYFLLIALVSFASIFIRAEPEGALVTNISSTTKNTTAADSLQNDKGTITIVDLQVTQQNTKWKAYVGNVSGSLVLRDAESYAIYEWGSTGSPSGEVYISRNNSIDWSSTSIKCANSTAITNEQNVLGHGATSSDNINFTFSQTLHQTIVIGEGNVTNSTCRSLYTYVNNAAQSASESALFQEVLLMDANMHIIYATVINQDSPSYNNDSAVHNMTYDFQAIVPDFTGASIATYYFYVEIDG